MKFENNVLGFSFARTAHPMRFTSRIKNNAMSTNPLAERFDFSFEDNNRDIVRIDVGLVACTRSHR